mmetsp:Transcript_57712/g.137320  ORF Transcript_57712/g.137320 Transcript_57712/m.137320 type:complete len:233 (+) Transcript_57712:324-1022(+)
MDAPGLHSSPIRFTAKPGGGKEKVASPTWISGGAWAAVELAAKSCCCCCSALGDEGAGSAADGGGTRLGAAPRGRHSLGSSDGELASFLGDFAGGEDATAAGTPQGFSGLKASRSRVEACTDGGGGGGTDAWGDLLRAAASARNGLSSGSVLGFLNASFSACVHGMKRASMSLFKPLSDKLLERPSDSRVVLDRDVAKESSIGALVEVVGLVGRSCATSETSVDAMPFSKSR